MLPFLCKYLSKYNQRPQWGFDFGHVRGTRGAKIIIFFLKKVEALLIKIKIKIKYIKVV